MSIAFGSINTGLPKDIVKQIISAEQIPIKKMEDRKGKIAERKGLVAELTGLVEKVRGNLAQNASARSFRELKVTSNEEIVGVTADKNIAEPGNYQFEVVRMAQKSSAMSSGFDDPDESYIGVGFIQYNLPDGSTKDVYIDSDNSSLKGIAKLINQDKSSGLRANVINDGTGSEAPWRLLLSLAETGDGQKAEFPHLYFVDGESDLFLEFERPAHDAMVRLDGFDIEVPENKANELIPGVNINLKRARPGEEFSIKIEEDSAAIATKVKGLVGHLNDVLKFIKDQNTMDENTDTSRTLGGDVILQTLESRIRATVFKDVETEYGMKRLGDIGIKFQRSGLLEFEEQKLDQMINKDWKEVAQVLTGYFREEGGKSKGFVDHLQDMTKMVLRAPDGLLVSRKRSVQQKIDMIDRRITDRQKRIETKEKNLKDKFARLEGTISRIKSQGAGIAALGGGAGSNPVTQLG